MALSILEKKWIEQWVRRLDAECRQVRDRDGRPRRTQRIQIKGLAEGLPAMVADFRQSYPGNQSLDAEIKACGAAYALGPFDAAAVPDVMLADHLTPKFLSLADERACEAVVAFGGRRKDGVIGDWNIYWPGAWEALFDMIRICVRPAVEWFGARVGGMRGKELWAWADSESRAIAVQIRSNLSQDCDCFARDADFHVKDNRARCKTEHSLAHWERENVAKQSLRDFLRTAAINGHLWLPDRQAGRTESANCNSIRMGILCRHILLDGRQIVAGPALKCDQKGCNADITLSDQCTNGHGVSPISESTWWFWKQNERGEWKCCRCGKGTGCNGLYFQHGPEAACPHCGRKAWSKKETSVYVRWEHLPPDARDLSVESQPINLSLTEIQAVLDGLNDEEEKFLATDLLLNRASLELARERLAEHFDRVHSVPEFRRFLRRIAHTVRNIVDSRHDEE